MSATGFQRSWKPRIERLLDALELLTAESPCSLDHDGNCHAHDSFPPPGQRCATAEAQQLLDEYRPGWRT